MKSKLCWSNHIFFAVVGFVGQASCGAAHRFLVGDPRQLPATIASPNAKKAGYGRSMLLGVEGTKDERGMKDVKESEGCGCLMMSWCLGTTEVLQYRYKYDARTHVTYVCIL